MRKPVQPEWFPAWTDYPHGSLEESRARQLAHYAVDLEAEHSQLITSLRSIEASLGTMDHAAAIEDERALPEYVSTKVAQLVSQDLRLSASLLKELESGDHLTEQLDAAKEKLNTFITILRELRDRLRARKKPQSNPEQDAWVRGWNDALNESIDHIYKLLPVEPKPDSEVKSKWQAMKTPHRFQSICISNRCVECDLPEQDTIHLATPEPGKTADIYGGWDK